MTAQVKCACSWTPRVCVLCWIPGQRLGFKLSDLPLALGCKVVMCSGNSCKLIQDSQAVLGGAAVSIAEQA